MSPDPTSLQTNQKVLGRTILPTFPYISYLFEVLEPNSLELNLSEPTLTTFNLI
jgi:hypothetical protein